MVWNETTRIVDFIEEKDNGVFFKVRGVEHHFERYHPYFSDNRNGFTAWLDSRFEQDVKYCGQCVPEKALFFAHVDCWRVAEHHGIDPTQLYRFAAQTQPVLPWRGDKPHNQLLDFFGCVGSLNHDTPLGKLLVEISRRLSPELHEIIMASLLQIASLKLRNPRGLPGAVPFSLKAREVLSTQLAAVESHVVPVLRGIPNEAASFLDLQPSRSRVSSHDPDSGLFGPVKALWIRVTNLFGRTYISEVGFDRGGNGTLSIPVSRRQITGLRFALGRFGLRAIRILYDGGSKSVWLGDPSGCWFGNVHGTRIRRLHTTANVRYYMDPPSFFAFEIPHADFSIIT